MPYPRYSRGEKEKRPTPWRLTLLILLATVLLFGLYAYFVMRKGVNWLFWVYLSVLLVSAVAYILYNRAFADASAIYENLPYAWSDKEKRDFLAARDERKQRSKWLLVLIFPLSITLMFDVIYLCFGDTLLNVVDAVGRGLGMW